MLSVITWAQSRWGSMPLALAGFSFGGYVQTRIANRLANGIAPPRQLVLVGMAAGETTGSARHYETPPVPKNMPTLLIHGENDEDVPKSTSDELARLRPDIVTYVEVTDAAHVEAWNVDPEFYEDQVARFIGRVAGD